MFAPITNSAATMIDVAGPGASDTPVQPPLVLRHTTEDGTVERQCRNGHRIAPTHSRAYGDDRDLGRTCAPGSHTHHFSCGNDRFTPYGGLRAMQVIPIDRGAVHDSPT